jgi:MYXO-CTERM domain-containing protein
MLLSGAAIAGFSAAASAALVIDVRATAVNGGTLVGPKEVVGVAPGSTVTMSVFALTTGNDGSTANDGILSFAGSFLTSGGTTFGNLVATRAPTMTGTGGSNGLVTDLDGDGDLDVGSNNSASATLFFSARSSVAPDPVFGPEVLVGTVTMAVTAGGLTPTLANFRPRLAGTAGSWFEDGTQITSSAFTAGAPVAVNGVPEPTALGLAGLAGLGALARRRR